MLRATLPLLLCTAALAGCGSDDEQSGAPVTPEGTNQVGMKDLNFVPEQITVKAGETITWTNQESVPHNVVNAEEGEQPKSELFNEGGTYEFTPKEPGKIDYVCTIHPGMEGTITVE